MIKIEPHCHSVGASRCADVSLERIVEVYSSLGYGGIVLTNHVNRSSFEVYPAETKKEKYDYFFSSVDALRDLCAPRNIKVFCGAEICAYTSSNGYSEYTVYGFDRKFMYDNKFLYEYSQEELFRLCEKNNVFMYQTHPFRERVECGNSQFMHGAEAFNGHYHHYNNNAMANKFCEDNNLIKMVGSDFHHPDQPVTAGMLIPDNVNDDFALTEYIRSGKAGLIEYGELYEKSYKEYLGK